MSHLANVLGNNENTQLPCVTELIRDLCIMKHVYNIHRFFNNTLDTMALRLPVIVLCLLVCSTCHSQVGAAEETAECVPSLTRSSTAKGPICRGALIFEDNFDFMDSSKWTHEITMAGGDSLLKIKPGKTDDWYGVDYVYYGTIDLWSRGCTVDWNDGCYRVGNDPYILNPVTSARLHTINTFSFLYGSVEIRAPLWMLPRDSVYGQWPASGEIDIMEARGNRDLTTPDGTNMGVDKMESTMHWGPDSGQNQFMRTHWEQWRNHGDGYNADFHVYFVEWTPDYIRFTVDNVEIGRVTPTAGGFYELGQLTGPNIWAGGTKMAPFDQEFFLIMNVAVGGSGYFPDGWNNPGGKPWTNGSPTSFKEFWTARGQWEPTWVNDGSSELFVDYVRVWAL
ncbi:hypothetical protein B566_EDAN004543 [Ephemera danica]|nr:hypothetical protein B566_EDAN004543 [Ephemera danica]